MVEKKEHITLSAINTGFYPFNSLDRTYSTYPLIRKDAELIRLSEIIFSNYKSLSIRQFDSTELPYISIQSTSDKRQVWDLHPKKNS